MGRFLRGRWGLSGPQPGFGSGAFKGEKGRTLKPGGRVTKEDAFPASAGHVLSRDEEDSTYRKSAKTGAARLARATAAEERTTGTVNLLDLNDSDEEQDELSSEEQPLRDPDEPEPDSDDLDAWDDPMVAAKQAKQSKKKEAREAVTKTASDLADERRKVLAAAASKRFGLKEKDVIIIEDSAASDNDAAPGEPSLDEWMRDNAPPHLRQEYFAKSKTRQAGPSSSSPPQRAKRALFNPDSDDDVKPLASTSKNARLVPPSSTAIKRTKKIVSKSKVEVVAGTAFVTKTYGEAPKMKLRRDMMDKRGTYEDSEEEKDNHAYLAREKAFQIHVQQGDRRTEKEEAAMRKIEKERLAIKAKFKKNREPGYSNPRRN